MAGTKSRNGGKRAHNKEEVESVNKTALMIGGAAAIVMVAVIIYSMCL